MIRSMALIAHSVLLESVRRREIYGVVFCACLLIAGVLSIDFFGLQGLEKFYRETALGIMGIATALTVIVLACRQLPRDFEQRTIYALLARPVGRMTFLCGKLLGVVAAAAACFALFMAVYVGGTLYLGGTIPALLFAQYVYLQLVMILVLASLCLWLSLVANLDAAITLAALFYLTAGALSSISLFLYDFAEPAGRRVLWLLNYAVPQFVLFDLSEKAVHAEIWSPLPAGIIAALTGYGLAFAALYLGLAYVWFRRRPL